MDEAQLLSQNGLAPWRFSIRHQPGAVSNVVTSALAQTLNHDREILEVKLPKGPAAYCSEQINGKPPKGCYHVKKTYQVTIEPGAHRKLVRKHKAPCDRMKVLSPEVPESHPRPQSGDAVNESPESSPQLIADAMQKREAYYVRARFRHQRAPAFEKAKRFPALANHRLVPEWRGSRPHHEDDKSIPHLVVKARERASGEEFWKIQDALRKQERHRTQRRLVAPTLSLAVRQETKRSPSPPNSWHPPIDTNGIKRECARTPMLCNEAYSPRVELPQRSESKERWVGECGFSCPGVPSLSEAKMAIAHRSYVSPSGVHAPSSENVAEEIQGVRERGVENNLRLQCRYEMKLEAYKAEQVSNGPMSNFGKRELREAQELNNLDLRDEPPKPGSPKLGLGPLSMGFARFKSTPHLEIDG